MYRTQPHAFLPHLSRASVSVKRARDERREEDERGEEARSDLGLLPRPVVQPAARALAAFDSRFASRRTSENAQSLQRSFTASSRSEGELAHLISSWSLAAHEALADASLCSSRCREEHSSRPSLASESQPSLHVQAVGPPCLVASVALSLLHRPRSAEPPLGRRAIASERTAGPQPESASSLPPLRGERSQLRRARTVG